MKTHLVPMNVYGSIQYEDKENKIIVSKVKDRWYPALDNLHFDAGFVNIECMTSFLENLDSYEEDLDLFGYRKIKTVYELDDPRFQSQIEILDDGKFKIKSMIYQDDGKKQLKKFQTSDFQRLSNHILDNLDIANIDIFSSIIFIDPKETKYVVEAAMSSRDLSKNLVRVKSSNVWSWGINIKNRKDKSGDVLVQFKNKNGGAGDIYLYYDIPTNTWRKMLAETSVGHSVWKYLRNNPKGYRKLTGDRKGKLPNAIN